MLTLHHAPWSRSTRIVWLLEELGIDYAIRYTDIPRMDGTGARDPGNPHPDGKVPALADGNALITESAAIALYLTDLFQGAGLAPRTGDDDRGTFLTWMTWTVGEMEPAYWGKISGATETDAVVRARYDAVIARILSALERGPYLMGERFTAVDIMVGASLGWGREHTPPSAVLDAYLARITARPAHQRATMKDGVPAQYAAA